MLGCFTSDPQIISMGRHLMLIDILVEIGRGFNHVEENSLRGAGDVIYPMAVSMISCWTMSILFSYILGIRMGLGLTGCWIAFAMDEFFRGHCISDTLEIKKMDHENSRGPCLKKPFCRLSYFLCIRPESISYTKSHNCRISSWLWLASSMAVPFSFNFSSNLRISSTP